MSKNPFGNLFGNPQKDAKIKKGATNKKEVNKKRTLKKTDMKEKSK